MLKIHFLLAALILFSACVQEVEPIEGDIASLDDSISNPKPMPIPEAPKEIIAIPPTLKSVTILGDSHQLFFEIPINADQPASGFDTYINNTNQNDHAKFQGQTRQISGLNQYEKQCFKIAANYSQLKTPTILVSNQVCIDAKTYPVPNLLSKSLTENTEDSALLTLNFDVPVNLKVSYGESISLGKIINDLKYKSTHVLNFKNLKSGTVYYYKIEANSEQDRKIQSEIFNFKTIEAKITLSPKAPVLISAKRIDQSYELVFKDDINALKPDGGYDTYIDGIDQNDNSQSTGLSRIINNLNIYQKHCFQIQSRYINPNYLLFESNEICVDAAEPTIPSTKPLSAKVLAWKKMFDEQTIDDNYQERLSKSGIGGDLYYLDVSPYVYMYQVTGEEKYLNFAMELFQNVMNTARPASEFYPKKYDSSYNDSYLTWACVESKGVSSMCRPGKVTGEVPLNETRGMRTVTRMLWILSKSSEFLSKGDNKAKYQKMLTFVEKHVWEKWESRGIGHIYRSMTHMASHWAQMGWFLNKITGKQKYRDVYENWSYKGFPSSSRYAGGNMRDQLRLTTLNGKQAYYWNGSWGAQTRTNDISHANAELELMVLGAEQNDYWTLQDMQRITTTFDQRIFISNDPLKSVFYIDGSGSGSALWDQGWVQLGRFSQQMQTRLENADLLPSHFYYQKVRIANLAYNQAYLEQNVIIP